MIAYLERTPERPAAGAEGLNIAAVAQRTGIGADTLAQVGAPLRRPAAQPDGRRPAPLRRAGRRSRRVAARPPRRRIPDRRGRRAAQPTDAATHDVLGDRPAGRDRRGRRRLGPAAAERARRAGLHPPRRRDGRRGDRRPGSAHGRRPRGTGAECIAEEHLLSEACPLAPARAARRPASRLSGALRCSRARPASTTSWGCSRSRCCSRRIGGSPSTSAPTHRSSRRSRSRGRRTRGCRLSQRVDAPRPARRPPRTGSRGAAATAPVCRGRRARSAAAARRGRRRPVASSTRIRAAARRGAGPARKPASTSSGMISVSVTGSAVETLDREPLGAARPGRTRRARRPPAAATPRRARAAARASCRRARRRAPPRLRAARPGRRRRARPARRRASATAARRRTAAPDRRRRARAARDRPRAAQLAQALDRARQRELGAAEPLDEVAAPAGADRLEILQLRVDGAVAARDPLAAHAVARDDALPLEQQLRERTPVGSRRRRGARSATSGPACS